MLSRRPYARHNRGRVSRGGGAPTPPWWPTADAPFAAYLAHPSEYSTVTEWGDDSGNGRVMSAASFSTDPSFSATAINGSEPGVVYSTHETKDLVSAASDWNFTASGEMGFVGRLRLASATNTQIIFSTRNGGFNSGTALVHDGGASNRLILYEVNGSAASLTLSATPIGTPPVDPVNFAISISRSTFSPHARIYINGTQIATANYVAANGNVASKAMQLGYGGDVGANHFNGAIEYLNFYNRPLTPTEVADYHALGAPTSQRTVRVVRCIGDSITANASTYRRKLMMRFKRTSNQLLVYQGSQTPAGNYPLADQRHDGVAGNTLAQMTARVSPYSGTTPTDVVLMGGTNNMGGSVASALTDMETFIDAVKAEHPSATVWVLAIPYGDGTTASLTLAGNAGTYNAALPALCASKGVNFVDIHSGAYAWVPATDASDGTGHPTPAGGDAMGNTLAVAMGIAGD